MLRLKLSSVAMGIVAGIFVKKTDFLPGISQYLQAHPIVAMALVVGGLIWLERSRGSISIPPGIATGFGIGFQIAPEF